MERFKPAIIALLSIAITLSGCGPGDPGVYKNAQIKSGKLSDFHKLNDQLFAALKDNNLHDVEDMMSKPLLATSDHAQTVDHINLQCKLGGYDILDEYYIVNYKPTDTHTIKTQATDGNKYTFYSTTVTEEMYEVFMIPKTKGDKYIVTAVFCKYNYGWRLNDLELGPYTVTGKTAPQLYDQATQKYAKGYVVDAFISMEMAYKCLQPNIMWIYPQNTEMNAFNGKLLNELGNYKYPLVVNVATKPSIFQITHSTTDEGVYPSIDYITKINLKDTTALRKEKEEVTKVIGKMFPGIDKDKKYIYFTAFNQMPNSKTSPPFVDMVAVLR